MALARNTASVLGAVCVNLQLYDPSVAAIVDIGSAPSTVVKHANVTLRAGDTWDGVSRPSFQTSHTGGVGNGITYSAAPPALKHGSGEGGSGYFVAMAKGPGTASDKQMIVTPSANFSVGMGYDAGSSPNGFGMFGANGTQLGGAAVDADASVDYSKNFAVVVESIFNTVLGRKLFVDADTGTQNTWDMETDEPGDAGTGSSVTSLGFSTAASTYMDVRIFVFANFSRLLTLAEAQQLRDDWYVQLIAASGGGGAVLMGAISL